MSAVFTYDRAAWPQQQPSLRPARKRWPLTCRWCHKSWSGSWGATPGDPERFRAGRVCTELPWQRDRNGQPSSVISDQRTTAQKPGASEAGVGTVECFVWFPHVGDLQEIKESSGLTWVKVTGLMIKGSFLNYSNFISYFRCSEGSVICQHSPAWIFQQIALDGRRYWAVVVTHADVGPPHFVHRCDLLQGLQDLILACQVFQKVKWLHTPTHKYLSNRIVYEQHSSATDSAWHGMTLINRTYICSLFQNSFKWKHATFHSPFSRDNSDKCTHPFITYFQ